MLPIQIEGNQYFRASDVADEIGVSCQTLWRWRLENKIPAGHRLRGKQVVVSADEYAAIRKFAFRLEPALPTSSRQLGLFNGKKG